MSSYRKAQAMTAVLLAATLGLAACGTEDESQTDPTDAYTTSAPPSAEDISFTETDFDHDLPESHGGIRCSSPEVVDVGGESYTLHSVAWANEGASSSAQWFLAPQKPRGSSFEFAVSYPGSRTLIYSSPATWQDWALYLVDKNVRTDVMPTEADYAPGQSLRRAIVPIPPELTSQLGEPLRMSATLNGQSLGECELH